MDYQTIESECNTRFVLESLKLGSSCYAVTLTRIIDRPWKSTREFANYFIDELTLKRLKNRVKKADFPRIPQLKMNRLTRSSHQFLKPYMKNNLVEMFQQDEDFAAKIFFHSENSIRIDTTSLGYPYDYNGPAINCRNEWQEKYINFDVYLKDMAHNFRNRYLITDDFYTLIRGCEQFDYIDVVSDTPKANDRGVFLTLKIKLNPTFLDIMAQMPVQQSTITVNWAEFVRTQKVLGDLVY